MRMRKRYDRTDAALEAAAEAKTSHDCGDEEPDSRARFDARERTTHPDSDEDRAGSHRALRLDVSCQEDAGRCTAREERQGQAPENVRRRSRELAGQRRTERAVEPRDRPDRDQRRDRGQERAAGARRDAELRLQRRKRARLAGNRLSDKGEANQLDDHDADQSHIDQVRGRGQVLDGDARDQCAAPGPGHRSHAVGDGPPRSVDVDQGSTDGAYRRAGRQALQHAARREHAHAGRGDEHDECDELDGQRREQHRPPTDVVGELSDDKQRGQHREGVDRKDDGDGDRRDAPPGLIDRVERGGHAGRREELDQDADLEPEGDP